MRVLIDGQWQNHGEETSVAVLLERLSLAPQWVAVELNRRIVPRARYGQTTLADNDELEIVTLVGGG